MATIPKQRPTVAFTRSGGPPHRVHLPEGGSQTFKKGDFLILSSGRVVISGSAPSAATVLGIAAHDASGVQDTPVAIEEANDDTLFVINGISTTAITHIGVACQLNLTSGNWTADTGTAANTLIPVKLDPRDTLADTNGRYICQVHSAARALSR